jgi:hypothetical protein
MRTQSDRGKKKNLTIAGSERKEEANLSEVKEERKKSEQ